MSFSNIIIITNAIIINWSNNCDNDNGVNKRQCEKEQFTQQQQQVGGSNKIKANNAKEKKNQCR